MRPATIVRYSLPDDFQRNTHALSTGAIATIIVMFESLDENLPVGIGKLDNSQAKQRSGEVWGSR